VLDLYLDLDEQERNQSNEMKDAAFNNYQQTISEEVDVANHRLGLWMEQ
jgi:hypothetical protein